MTPRENVLRTLEFRHKGRVPRQMWKLPWADMQYPAQVQALEKDFPTDFAGPSDFLREIPPTKGVGHLLGEYVDEWGCTFTNIQPGVIGEVKQPVSTEEDWPDIGRVHIPVELLSVDVDKVNGFCRSTDHFVFAGACPRPFEQLQFIRGTEQFYVDLMERPPEMEAFMGRMHAFYCELLELWAGTEVDALNFMDDWGAQRSLLIAPALWREVFGPMYKDYIDIAHRAGKKIFMHSDGYTIDIFPDLIEMGLDAINSQVFCMGLDTVEKYAGQITFWGEMDRQHLLPYGTPQEIKEAARAMREHLYRDGGVIAQLEFGIGAKPENVRAYYEAWDEMGT